MYASHFITGTGKTTVARLMGKIFHDLGLIPCEDVIEVSASDMITGQWTDTGALLADHFNQYICVVCQGLWVKRGKRLRRR